jgi:prepilin-type processing-associated H-X9-DG protein
MLGWDVGIIKMLNDPSGNVFWLDGSVLVGRGLQ